MSINPMNDISEIYSNQVSFISEDKKIKDNNLANNYPPYDKVTRGDVIAGALGKDQMGGKRKKVKEELVGGQTKIDVASPYGKLTAADFKELRKRKPKKVVKENLSNWREELLEVADIVTKEKNPKQIKEKKVSNKIKQFPVDKTSVHKLSYSVRESIENLGGILLEMVEIDEVDYIVESVYDELLEEGYEEDDIEEAIEYALIEAKVTYGHDTPTGEKKKSKNILRAVGRLARQKLSSKVRSAKSATKGAIASGARKVAKSALGVARKIEGDTKPSRVHSKSGTRSSSTYRGSGSGQKERVSSGSYTPPSKSSTEKKSETYKDPWEGSATTPPRSEKKTPKATQKTATVPKKPLSKKQKQAVVRAQRRNPNLSSSDAERIVSSVGNENQRGKELRARMAAAAAKRGISEDYYDLEAKSVKPGKPGAQQKQTIQNLAKIATTKKKTRNPVGTSRRGGGSFKPSSPEEAKSNIKSWADYWSSAAKGYKEQYEILEKAESEQQQKIFGLALSVKRGQTSRDKVSDKVLNIVDGMSEKQIRDFAKTSHKGLPHKVETKEEAIRQELIARMIEKIEMQSEYYFDEAKLPRSEKKSKKAEKLSVPKRPKHLVQLDLDQAGVREVKNKKLRDPETGKKKTTKVEPAKINVKGETGNVVRTVSTGDFHKEKLGKGETMDFSPLRDPEKFKKTTKANKHAINKARGAVVEPNTARGAFRKQSNEELSLSENKGNVDNKSIVQHLQNIGYTRKRGMKVKPGHFTGDMPGSGSPGKKLIATKHDIEKYQPKKVSHIDDDPKNLEPLEKHRQSTQGSRGETRGSDPKIHTQHVGSYKKRGEGRSEPREHGRIRRFSGVRDAGNVPEPQTTKQIQRARKKARKGMQKESIDIPPKKETQKNQSSINQVLQAKQEADAAERKLAIKQRMASQKGVNLASISS